ncbi:MAG: transcription-repair coupling factor [Thermodesulfobacteria bacterium]|nr:transcription-repair coupling factor [Thermodesulfobacteriota bacterium]
MPVEDSVSFLEKLAGERRILSLKSSSVSACSFLVSKAFKDKVLQILWVAPQKELVEERRQELSFFTQRQVGTLPAYEHFPFLPLVPCNQTASKRIGTLHNLMEQKPGVVVAPPSVLLERFVPGDKIRQHSELVMAEEELERDSFIKWLVETGYERMPTVQFPGQFAVRGDIIDVFSPGYNLPVRLLFFDELVEEIRFFDIDTQRTVEKRQEVVLLPSAESILTDALTEKARDKIVSMAGACGWSGEQVGQVIHSLENRRQTEGSLAFMPFLYGRLWSIFDYLGDDAIIVVESPMEVASTLWTTLEAMEASYEAQVEKGRLLPELDSFRLDFTEICKSLEEKRRLYINPPKVLSGDQGLSDNEPGLDKFFSDTGQELSISSRLIEPSLLVSRSGAGSELFGPFFNRLAKWQAEKARVNILAQSDGGLKRLASLFQHYGQEYQLLDGKEKQGPFATEAGLFLAKGYSVEAFELEDARQIFIPDHCLFKSSLGPKKRKKSTRAKKTKPVSLSEIGPGDLVVHRDKGIGRYLGLVRMDVGGVESEFVHLEYQGGDKLYVPVDRLALLQKYVGLEGKEPRLDRLGGKSWLARKAKVKKAIKEVAHELVELYALRKVKEGVSFEAPDEMYRQFEAAFPYDETQDQLDAVRDILEDLQAGYPMDRLLCGDVGFGKTEVAMRAAFLAVANGYQVAVLVPTTLLAEQHERTFKERFKDFPVRIAGLSRLRSRKEQREILSRVKEGQVDILIGTHRLLQNDVVFNRLGLIVIDEEHRFGVKHKEKLKLLARDINCLSLTATPIPRTLQLSLLGIRDLSVLETPPRGRVAIKTFLAEYDDAIVKEAITREIKRGGQVFFVHNRVKGIHRVAEHISALVPEARIDVAHGQMEPAELEKKMIRFVRGDVDCLVCTTIIESGLDIPSANTLIVNRADMLGIADLYQLRGRVGRGNRQAYAYLFVPSLESMGKDASLRIKAIMETSELGAGMNLAMHDLKIRGAGNLLGVAQAGQISEVGYDLYLDLLKEAIEDIKGNKVEERLEPEVNLSVPAYIPEEYSPDLSARMELYRWFSQIDSVEEKDEILQELEDRFGHVPEPVANLLEIMVIKSLLRPLNCVRLDGTSQENPRLTLTFGPSGPRNVDKLLKLIQKDGRLGILPGERLSVKMSKKEVEKRSFLKETARVLKELLKLTN